MSNIISDAKQCFRCGDHNVSLVYETEFFGMDEDEFGGEDVYVSVMCNNCGIIGGFHSSAHNAIDVWNSRAGIDKAIVKVSKKTTMISI